ncbi:translational activator of GCN4 [Lobosporangium transversale]|uniref:eIF-2-alpha kinase activator GCN1 n=1 Tax=Lobosporangium transversale TaxID=64571 RepID=A0A1Y2GSW8_9FUNG|nr:armadillo-type protein [Lobosporangium transversale]KAF9918095.1 translational activator of GCN4 [Lobosporangium transversale]ORZ21884.1 armadillo-type protein [Lobosporangium transversale]|eukprot:XP_021883135.1 armadillo-type protein [Lobosporangium transversale]
MQSTVSTGSHDPSENPWSEYIKETLLPSITTASVNERTQLLHLLLVRIKRKDLPIELLPALVHILFISYPRYHDRHSRLTVLDILIELNNWNSDEFLKVIVPAVQREAERLSAKSMDGVYITAAVHRFVILNWINVLLNCVLATTSAGSSSYFKPLISSQAVLIDGLVDSDKKSVANGAIADVRRCIRKNAASIPLFLEYLTSTTTTPAYLNSVLLGTVIDVALRLKHKADAAKEQVSSRKDAIIKFYLTNLISSKQAVPVRCAVAFNDFIHHYVTLELFRADLLPTIERLVLRAPEIVFALLIHLVKSVSFDPSPIFGSSLQDPLLNGLRSTSEPTRISAIALFKQFAVLSKEEEYVLKVVSEMTKQLTTGKISSPDHRGIFYDCVGKTASVKSELVSVKALQGLTTMISKESNETAVTFGIDAAILHLQVLLTTGKETPELTAVIKAGVTALGSPRASLRKTWARGMGSLIWNADYHKDSTKSVSLFLAPLTATYNNIQKAPLTYKDGPLEGYVAVSVAYRIAQYGDATARQLIKSALTISPKPSIILYDKVYTKLTTAEESIWFVHALEALVAEEVIDHEAKMAIGTGFIYVAAASPFADARKEAFHALQRSAKSDLKKIGTIIKEALIRWVSTLENPVKDSTVALAATTIPTDRHISTYRLSEILSAITTFNEDADQTAMAEVATELIVLSHHEAIASPTKKYDWMSVVQRARLDPGRLVADYQDRIEQLIMEAASLESTSPQMYKAAMSTISSLVFIAPSIMIPIFMGHIEEDLDAKLLDNIGEQEIAIWKHPEGELYIDVLKGAKKQGGTERGRIAFDEQKFNREVKKALSSTAQKKALTNSSAPAPPKLTKDEQASVDAQLAKESKIRKSVQNTHSHLIRGLATISALVDGNPEELTAKLVELVRVLLNGVVKRSGPLVGTTAVDTYLLLGRCVSDRLDTIRVPLALATLRSLGVKEIPENYLEEPLEELVSRVLYRLRYVTGKQPLLPPSFAYCFPLIHNILQNGGIVNPNKSATDAKETSQEQVQIAVDIVSFHALSGASDSLPRKEMIASLISIIKEYPQLAKTAKDSLSDLTHSMGNNATLDEINTLLEGLLYNEVSVRQAVLAALEPLELTIIDFSRELWTACYDEDAMNAKLAFELWEDNGMEVEPTYAEALLPYVVHQNGFVRQAAAKAIAGAIKLYPDTVSATLNAIYLLYHEKAQPIVPQYNEFGLVIQESLNRQDPSDQRLGLSMALKNIAPLMTAADLQPFAEFLIRQDALGDRNADVRQGMLDAGLAMITAHGAENVHTLIPVFENYLSEPARNSEAHDRIRESAVILFGALARHLDPSSPKIPSAVQKLIETLDTPSEAVQVAVANCLPGLVKCIPDQVPDLLNSLMDKTFHSKKYSQRRGAAYGLAGVIKGCGISALKEFSIMASLKAAVDDKKDPHAREGAMIAFETLSQTLGRLFEPYVIQILPLLLVCFGDSVMDVRQATSDTARAIMGKLSGHCVKLIMPHLLAGLDDRQWRTKKGSVELLGSMAYCAPKQLSISLPTIIPRLSDVLTDSHTAVQEAARLALTQFGEVISNPEIQDLVPIMMAALCDPNTKTHPALTALLGTSFVHYIDSPSLALVMPILERGLRERATDIKKKASQIVGNMASLTDQKDLIPYLPRLLPGVKEVLIDPVPEARATAAKALGTLVEKLGESNFPDLVHELLDTLKSDTSGVDRQGAAQGLSEVLAGLGLERLEGLLPEIIINTDSPKSYVREGFISLLVYLPATFGQRFQPYLGRIIPPILMGLADESEYVREASLKAGQMIINNYATKAVDLLLPELERGLFDDNWRIRQSSVQLMGDLLFRITGTSKQTGVDDENEEDAPEEFGRSDNIRKKLIEVLGRDRRDRVLSSLYIVRADNSAIVRQASLTVWKSLVTNTPRTLREILPTIMSMIIRNLASSSYDRRMVAARTLGDLVRKLGEAVLSEIIPILEAGLESPESDTRQGVCIGLSEIMATAGKVHVQDYVDSIIPAVRKALLDESPDVREAAAQAFDTLHQCVGPKAIDEILPSLLANLHTGDKSEYALEGLKEIMAVRSNVVFPVLIPNLIAQPITAFNARALGSLVSVAGTALNRRLTNILAALIQSQVSETDEDTLQALESTTCALLQSIDNADGTNTLMMMLFELVKSEDSSKRSSGCNILATFCTESTQDISRYVSDWIRVLISLLDDRTHYVVVSALAALNAVTRTVRKEELEGLVQCVRRAVRAVGTPGMDLPGFCLPKGIAPLLPIFLQGLMNGSNAIREASALGVGDLIQRTSPDALKPFVTQITGPLIRIVGDRHPGEVKSAILSTLSLLLQKVPAHLKPFLPQLQRTFIKSLTDPTSATVRVRAATALSILISLQTRVDPLVTELIAGIKASESGVKETVMSALETAVSKIGAGMSDAAKRSVISVVMEGMETGNSESMWLASAKLLGAFCKHQSTDEAAYLVQTQILGENIPLSASMLAINSVLVESPQLFIETGHVQEVANAALAAIPNPVEGSSTAAVLAIGKMLINEAYQVDQELIGELLKKLTLHLSLEINIESKRLILVSVRAVARQSPWLVEPHLKEIVPLMMTSVRERVIPIKLAAERALLFALQLQKDDSIYQKYLGTIDTAASKALTDYHRRILSKLAVNERARLEQLHGQEDAEAAEEDAEVYSVGGLNLGTNDDE